MKTTIEVEIIVKGALRAVKGVIVGMENGTTTITTIDPCDWQAAKKNLLAGARGCFCEGSNNGELVSALNPSALMRWLHNALLIAL